MVEVWLPYGKTETVVRVQDEQLLGILEDNEKVGVDDPEHDITRAIEPQLEGMSPHQTIAIVVNDVSRPSRLILSCLLQKMNQLGFKARDINVILGYSASSMTKDDGYTLLSDEFNDIHFHIHDCNAKDLEFVGETSFGTKVMMNKVFMDADIKILTGVIGFHHFAGYSGGRMSILPGIVGLDTIKQNHALMLSPKARKGNLDGNPVHEDMEEALHLINVDLAVNVVLNSKRDIVKAFSGDVDRVFREGVQLVDEMYKLSVKSPADIVIMSPGGAPFDVDLYQACKGIDSMLDVVTKNGVVILVAECLEGYSNKIFYDWMMRLKSLSRIKREIRRNFVLGGQMAFHLMNALTNVRIILVSVMPDYYATGVFRLRTAKTANAALKLALRMVGRNKRILIIPNGSTTVPIIR